MERNSDVLGEFLVSLLDLVLSGQRLIHLWHLHLQKAIFYVFAFRKPLDWCLELLNLRFGEFTDLWTGPQIQRSMGLIQFQAVKNSNRHINRACQ